MARKGWESLSQNYRTRLEKAGLTRRDYESHRSLQKARGHSRTPEHPRQYSPEKFPEYTSSRTQLTRRLERRKERIWGDRPRWNHLRSSRAIRDAPPSMNMLRQIDAMDDDELEELFDHAIREDAEAYRFLGYH